MRKRLAKRVYRGLLAMLMALFAVPCIACEEPVALRSGSGMRDLLPVRGSMPGPGCAHVETSDHPVSTCAGLCDAPKLPNERSATSPAMRVPLVRSFQGTEPAIARSIFQEPDSTLFPLLLHPAVPDRAPPAG